MLGGSQRTCINRLWIWSRLKYPIWLLLPNKVLLSNPSKHISMGNASSSHISILFVHDSGIIQAEKNSQHSTFKTPVQTFSLRFLGLLFFFFSSQALYHDPTGSWFPGKSSPHNLGPGSRRENSKNRNENAENPCIHVYSCLKAGTWNLVYIYIDTYIYGCVVTNSLVNWKKNLEVFSLSHHSSSHRIVGDVCCSFWGVNNERDIGG